MIPGKRIVRPEEEPFAAFGWGKLKFLCEPSLTNAEHLTVAHVWLEPGQGHLRHNHPGSEEILFIIAGTGEQMVETDLEEKGGKPETFNVKPGDLIHIPASVYHQTINTGKETMQILAVYSPCGPEKALRELPDYRLIPVK